MPRRFGWIRRLPSGRHQASYMLPGGDRVTAPSTFRLRSNAEAWLADEREALARQAFRAGRRTAPTFRTFAADWLGSRGDLRPRTVQHYTALLRLHVVPTFGERLLPEITSEDVRAWYRALGSETGQSTRSQSYRLLSTILRQAVDDGELALNPCSIPGAGVYRPAERTAPTLLQIDQLSEAVPSRYRAIVYLAGFGGLRFGEIVGLTVGAVDPRGPAVLVRRALIEVAGRQVFGPPKSHAGTRMVWLPEFMAEVLDDHLLARTSLDPDALVFTTRNGTPLTRTTWGKSFARAAAKVGIPGTHFHDLRHAAATMATQSGATLTDTMARLGHASAKTALTYQHTSPARDQAIARALGAARERGKR